MRILQRRLLLAGAIITLSAALFYGCKKNDINVTDDINAPQKVAIYLTDDPCQFDSVFIDVKYIELKIDTSHYGRMNRYNDNDDDHYEDMWQDCHREDHRHFGKHGIWDTLKIKPGLYNILALRNGNSVIFATGQIPAGKILMMRLTLGERSYVVVSGKKYDLSLFHSEDNFTYVRIFGRNQDRRYRPGQNTMWVDFNICRSIKYYHHNYYLKPFMRIFSKSTTGSLFGRVSPHAAQPFIVAWNDSDTASALPERDGDFKIEGLSAGTYSVMYEGAFGYKDTTISNIQVTEGKETKLPDITLHQ